MKAVRRWLRDSRLGRVRARRALEQLVRAELAGGEPELRVVPFLCRADRTMVDVGANRGICAHIARPWSSHVVAIEPNPVLAGFIRRSSGAGVRVIEAAVSDQAGAQTLHIPMQGTSEWDGLSSLRPAAMLGELPYKSLDVRVVRLDDLDLPPVGLIKIDIEGYEVQAIRGAAGLITRDRPVILVEAEERHCPGSLASISHDLTSQRYQGYFIHGVRVAPLADFRAEVHQNVDNVQMSSKIPGRLYINNFLFIPAEQSEALVETMTSRLRQ
jgi:FkbM family methyltransferase